MFAAVAVVGVSSCGTASHPSHSQGATVFASDCAQCHSLIGNESLRRQGGDLLGYHFSRPQLVGFTREMPVRHPLSAAQLDAVVAYVLAAQRRVDFK